MIRPLPPSPLPLRPLLLALALALPIAQPSMLSAAEPAATEPKPAPAVAPAPAVKPAPAAEPAPPADGLPLPGVEAAQQELHGTLNGLRFWARLTPADKQFGNNRVMQLVYTPPPAAELGGAHLTDCPFLLLDPQLRVVAWNGRDSGSKVVPGVPTGYAITRETTVGEGDDKRIQLMARTLAGDRGWDLRIAPVLLAIGWHAGTSASVRVVDLFGPRSAEAMTLTWKDTAVTIAGAPCTAVADENGRLKSLNAADGTVLLSVAGHL